MNLDIEALAKAMSHGAAGSTTPNAYGSESSMRRGRPAMGGATAGIAANPAREGNPGPRGRGSGSLVPNAAPHIHALTRASLAHLKSIGRPHPEHHDIMRATQGHLDSYAVSKRRQAAAASQPKAPRGFGSLAGDADGGPEQTGLLSSGDPGQIPSGSAMDTSRSPLNTQTSGGVSRVPNSSFTRRRGPMRGPMDY